jgi:hypothetical protein
VVLRPCSDDAVAVEGWVTALEVSVEPSDRLGAE